MNNNAISVDILVINRIFIFEVFSSIWFKYRIVIKLRSIAMSTHSKSNLIMATRTPSFLCIYEYRFWWWNGEHMLLFFRTVNSTLCETNNQARRSTIVDLTHSVNKHEPHTSERQHSQKSHYFQWVNTIPIEIGRYLVSISFANWREKKIARFFLLLLLCFVPLESITSM